jgi:hypothetical protein
MGIIYRILLVASITGSLLSCGWIIVGPLQHTWTALFLAVGFLAATLATAGLLRLNFRCPPYSPEPRQSAQRARRTPNGILRPGRSDAPESRPPRLSVPRGEPPGKTLTP